MSGVIHGSTVTTPIKPSLIRLGHRKTAPGESLIIENTVDSVIHGLKLYGNAGAGSKNLFSLGEFEFTTATSGSGYAVAPEAVKDFILELPNGVYTISFTPTPAATGATAGSNIGKIAFQAADSSFLISARQTFELTDDVRQNTKTVVLYGYVNTTNTVKDFMLNVGTTALPYEPYNGGAIKVTTSGKNLANPWETVGQEWGYVRDGSIEVLSINDDSITVKVVGKIHSINIPVVKPITQFSTCWTINSSGGESWKHVIRKSDGTPHGAGSASGVTVDQGNITGGAYVVFIRIEQTEGGIYIPEGTEVTITGYINEGQKQAVQTPFAKPSFCTIPTPNGLGEGDHIDFLKGVRLENGVERPLTEEEMAQYAELRTVSPTTYVFNDAGVGMEVSYYLPNAALPVSGGAMGGHINMGNHRITGLGEPVHATDATPYGIVSSIAVESTYYPGCFYREVDGSVEWLNPPFVASEEYRTTDRYMGKAVYTKLIYFGEITNSGVKTVNTKIPSTASIVCLDRTATEPDKNTYINHISQLTHEYLWDNNGQYWLDVSTDSNVTNTVMLYYTIKYTKD